MAILSHKELLSNAGVEEDSKWLVEGLIRKASLGICGAPPKCGKTWLCLAMAQAISTGTPFLGRFKVYKSRVLFLELEDSSRMLAERSIALMRGHGIPEPEPGFLNFMLDQVRIDTPDGVENLRRALSETQAKFLIIDTLNRSHAMNENLQVHASQLISTLDKLRREFQCCIIAVHHLAKSAKGGQGGRALRGSSVIHAGLENSLYLTRVSSDGIIHVEPESKFIQVDPFSYKIDGHDGKTSLQYVDPSHPQTDFIMPDIMTRINMSNKERKELMRRWDEHFGVKH
jgi:RecA-family ATPase